MKTIVLLFLVAFSFSACLKDEPFKLVYTDSVPESLDDGWVTGTPAAVGMDEAIIDEVYQSFFSEDNLPLARSLLIVKDGILVAEAYCRNADDRETISNIKSATKSVTSILTGIALEKNFLDSLNQTIYQVIPEYFDTELEKRQITIFDVLTMQTGLDWNNDKDTRPLITGKEESSLEMVLDKDIVFTPGTDFQYTDGNPQLLSGAITATSGKSLLEFADEHLFKKMGITDFYWEQHPDGLNFGAVALYLKPRDVARFGVLCLQNGSYGTEQLVSSAWLAASTQTQTLTDEGDPYGFYWWIRPDYNAFTAIGHGGQYIYVIPSVNLAIIMTSEPYAGAYDGRENLQEFEELIVKKVLEAL